LADRGRTSVATTTSAIVLAIAFAVLYLGRHNVWLIVLGIIFLDAGSQGIHVSNQSIIYAIAPTQRSTINSIYMVCFFIGAAVGSLASGFAYARWGWNGTCAVGAAFGIATIIPALWWRTSEVASTANSR
jgi:predicted MFS family arabinose efflux permease